MAQYLTEVIKKGLSFADKDHNGKVLKRVAICNKVIYTPQKEMTNGFPKLVKGCFIHLEKYAQKYILDNIKKSLNSRVCLVYRIATHIRDTGRELSLSNIAACNNLSLLYSKGPGASFV